MKDVLEILRYKCDTTRGNETPVTLATGDLRLAIAEIEDHRRVMRRANPVVDEIAAERRRQQKDEGWDPITHDDPMTEGQLAAAAACYANPRPKMLNERPSFFNGGFCDEYPEGWPWDPDFWKPKDRRRNLVRAAALIIAEIERLDRAEAARAGQEESR